MFTDHSEVYFPPVWCKPEEELLLAATGLFSKLGHIPCPPTILISVLLLSRNSSKAWGPGQM